MGIKWLKKALLGNLLGGGGFHLGSSGGGHWAWQEPDHQLRSEAGTAPLRYLQPRLSKGIRRPDCHPAAVHVLLSQGWRVHVSAARAAAPRRADIFCGGRADGDGAAAQMLLEYQDKCARLHMCTRPQPFKALAGQLLRGMLLSAITGLTLRLVVAALCQARVNPRLLWPTVMETLELMAFGSAGRRARACLKGGGF